MNAEAPTLRGTLQDLSPAVKQRWQSIMEVLERNEQQEPRCDQNPGLGERPEGDANGSGTAPLRQSTGQCSDRPQADSDLSWYQIACDIISVDRALRPSSYQAPRRSVDDNYDIYRPVDFPGM